MTSERERFHYVVEFATPEGRVRETFLGALWPPPQVIRHQRRRWRLLTASVLTDGEMRLLRRTRTGTARAVPVRTATYQARSDVGAPLVCGHPLAFDDGCTVCTPIPCDACLHPAHLGSCQSTLGPWVDRWTAEEEARAACPCDSYIGPLA